MLYQYEVATAGDSDGFINEFRNRLSWIEQRGYTFKIIKETIDNYGDQVFLGLQGHHTDSVFKDEDILYIFKHQMSEVLAEHIVNEWETRFLWKEISKCCKQNSPEEKQRIFLKSSHFLHRCNENESISLLLNFGRKNRIAHRLFDYINESEKLVVQGFINFYMQDYLNEIRFAVDIAVEELRNEKEYNEFIKLLRYFVETQIPKTIEVNLLMDSHGVFYLWDEKGEHIEDNYINYYLDDMLLNDINLDDILISILITIAPKRIILHNTKESELNDAVKIIKSVFKERIQICKGCNRCRYYRKDWHRH